MRYAELLNEEFQKSTEYRKSAMTVDSGPEFAAVQQDLVQNSAAKLLATWVADTIAMGLSDTHTKIMSMFERSCKPEEIVREQRMAFLGLINYFYLGLQVGRRLEREEMQVLKDLETK